MTSAILNYFEEKDLQKLAEEKNFDEISFEEFIRFIDEQINEEEKFNTDPDEIKENILNYALDYMKIFIEKKAEGYSLDWVKADHFIILWDGKKLRINFSYSV
ncbi:MAG: hypothetical protein RBT49_00005 [Bacteroidales bacterium]|jgi:hypothetical protein|nr:hypothetical protein [Bacteroidales bacterium]